MSLAGLRQIKPKEAMGFTAPLPPSRGMSNDAFIKAFQRIQERDAMLPTIHVSVPMPRIKNDPRFVGIPEMDSEDAAMIRAWVNDEAEQELVAAKAAIRKRLRGWVAFAGASMLCGLAGVCLTHSPWWYSTILTLAPLLYVTQKYAQKAFDIEKKIQRTKSEKLAELGLCPPPPR